MRNTRHFRAALADQRYSYDAASSNSGKRYAINMNVQAGPETLQEQARKQQG